MLQSRFSDIMVRGAVAIFYLWERSSCPSRPFPSPLSSLLFPFPSIPIPSSLPLLSPLWSPSFSSHPSLSFPLYPFPLPSPSVLPFPLPSSLSLLFLSHYPSRSHTSSSLPSTPSSPWDPFLPFLPYQTSLSFPPLLSSRPLISS